MGVRRVVRVRALARPRHSAGRGVAPQNPYRCVDPATARRVTRGVRRVACERDLARPRHSAGCEAASKIHCGAWTLRLLVDFLISYWN